jgi:hypothetical protein
MKGQIAAALCAAVLGLAASLPVAIAQQPSNSGTSRAAATPNVLAVGAGNPAGDRQVFLSIRDLMESIIDPSADTLWGAVGTVVDNEGIHELFPKSQEEWREPRRAAVRIIEGSNLLMMPDREAAQAGTKSEAPGTELEPPQITVLSETTERASRRLPGRCKMSGWKPCKQLMRKTLLYYWKSVPEWRASARVAIKRSGIRRKRISLPTVATRDLHRTARYDSGGTRCVGC